jgi:hypothetical protein
MRTRAEVVGRRVRLQIRGASSSRLTETGSRHHEALAGLLAWGQDRILISRPHVTGWGSMKITAEHVQIREISFLIPCLLLIYSIRSTIAEVQAMIC